MNSLLGSIWNLFYAKQLFTLNSELSTSRLSKFETLETSEGTSEAVARFSIDIDNKTDK